MDELKLDIEDRSTSTYSHPALSPIRGLPLSEEEIGGEMGRQDRENDKMDRLQAHLDGVVREEEEEEEEENRPLYTFVDDEIAMMHTERFYALKQSFMTVESFQADYSHMNMNDNEQNDRLLLADEMNAEFIKRSEMYTDSASAVCKKWDDDHGDHQQHDLRVEFGRRNQRLWSRTTARCDVAFLSLLPHSWRNSCQCMVLSSLQCSWRNEYANGNIHLLRWLCVFCSHCLLV